MVIRDVNRRPPPTMYHGLIVYLVRDSPPLPGVEHPDNHSPALLTSRPSMMAYTFHLSHVEQLKLQMSSSIRLSPKL